MNCTIFLEKKYYEIMFATVDKVKYAKTVHNAT